ncbi:hypothetical protein LXA43DRAFT_885912 [Ganoderma leucocontextum]|nr:hypothetical protein LXA43DRAFT_885912 [Ganoderma leucocontextum]
MTVLTCNQVAKRWKTWSESREGQSKSKAQLQWTAEICEYLIVAEREGHRDGFPCNYGPLFEPPSYVDEQLRDATPMVTPETAYLKSVHVVHRRYYPHILGRCPRCQSTDIIHNGWSPTGPREVHGLMREEMAIGTQIRCKRCKERVSQGDRDEAEDTGTYCFTTTSHLFWDHFEHWELPGECCSTHTITATYFWSLAVGLPHFFSRCAVTSDLFDLIVEFRLSETAGGLTEHIKRS